MRALSSAAEAARDSSRFLGKLWQEGCEGRQGAGEMVPRCCPAEAIGVPSKGASGDGDRALRGCGDQ